MRPSLRSIPLILAELLLISCAAVEGPDPGDPLQEEPLRLPPLGSVLTTLDRRLGPAHAIANPAGLNPSLIENRQAYLDGGFGVLDTLPGEPHVALTLDGAAAPKPGPNARRLVHFVHLADVHVIDDESPTRLGRFDLPDTTASALRPQDADACRMVSAAVRTINALHRQDPLAFTLMGGDNIDSMQGNELDWFLSIFDGGRTTLCDSGARDPQLPGSGNDGKDPFISEGLTMPWRWVTGNHDVNVQGILPFTEELATQVVGNEAPTGTRDYAHGGALLIGQGVVADARRALVQRTALLTQVKSSGDGHGIGETQAKSGKAFYAFDVPDTQLRFVILDTGSETGGEGGMLHRADVVAYVTPLLEDAKQQGKWVILAAHHAADNLSQSGGPTGTPQADALLPAEWKSYLDKYPVVFSMNAHYHRHQIGNVTLPSGRKYWEVLTSSLADSPHEFRNIEIWDEDNGYLKMRATCIDPALEGDEVATQARTLSTIDLTSGFAADGTGTKADRNVELYIAKP